jgi:hypothetical protein
VSGSNPLTLVRTARSFRAESFKRELHVIHRRVNNDLIPFRVMRDSGNVNAVMADTHDDFNVGWHGQQFGYQFIA